MQEFWDRVRAKFVGLEFLCGEGGILSKLQLDIETARENGTGWADLKFNFVLSGPPGTGKSTIAREIIGPFLHALDALPSPELVNPPTGYRGDQLQAGYVGQTTAKVDQIFSDGFGKTIFIDEFSGWHTSGFATDIKKALCTWLEDYPNKYALVVADYAPNIQLVFDLDPGLASRFDKDKRIQIPRWTPDKCTELLLKTLSEKKVPADDHRQTIFEHFQIICSKFSDTNESVGFASGRTVGSISKELQSAFNCARRQQPSLAALPAECVHTVMTGYADYLHQLVQQANESVKAIHEHMTTRPRAAIQSAAQTAAAAAPATARKEGSKLSKEDLSKYLAAIESVDTMLGDDGRPKFSQYNDPETGAAQQEADIADENSEYNKELAKMLGVAPAEARKVRVRVAIKVKKMVTKCRTKMLQKFQYHCPWCNQVDSPSCEYIDHSLEFKMAHSKKKPWVEQLDEFYTEEIEEETFEEREHVMKASAGGSGGA